MTPGILWNLSSKDSLKEKLTRETLSELTESVLVPLCHPGDSGHLSHSPSEADIFYNTTGCLRSATRTPHHKTYLHIILAITSTACVDVCCVCVSNM